ncbi:MAG: asparaginase domain-containing protein [Arcobacteraceae bacterium]|nr:asparaginase domain-containing protein [Arcobacteraceae bacterium]
MSKNIKIINVGGTFNKVYIPTTGELIVPKDSVAIEEILEETYKTNPPPQIEGLIYKDSLAMDKNDRKLLLNKILSSKEKRIIIVHGTDTMKKSAKVLSKFVTKQTIVFVGAMKPFSYEKVEASTTLGMALGFLQSISEKGVFICMNGLIKKYNKIKKDYKKGVFICQ